MQNKYFTGADTTSAALYRISAFEIHPDYNATLRINDIALIQTESHIMYSLYVGPVCLPFRYTPYDFYGQTVTALGKYRSYPKYIQIH